MSIIKNIKKVGNIFYLYSDNGILLRKTKNLNNKECCINCENLNYCDGYDKNDIDSYLQEDCGDYKRHRRV